jgi:hypothetical protein
MLYAAEALISIVRRSGNFNISWPRIIEEILDTERETRDIYYE